MELVFYYLAALIVLSVTHLVYKWRNPKCNGVLPPGSMGLPFIGETLQYFSPQPQQGIPPFISKRISRYGPLFRTSLLGQRIVFSTDPVVNQYIFQQEGDAFRCWYTESSIKIIGEKNLNGQQGNAHKYLRNLVLDLIGPENLKGGLIHEMDRNTRHHLSSWACKDEVEVKEELEIMVFKLAAQKLLDFDEQQILELRNGFNFFKKAFLSLPFGIPGTALHSALQVELLTLRDGLKFAWERRFQNLIVEIDSEVIYKLVQKTDTREHPLDFILEDCRTLLTKPWNISTRHIRRSANSVANALAKLGHILGDGLHLMEEPPDSLHELVDRERHLLPLLDKKKKIR